MEEDVDELGRTHTTQRSAGGGRRALDSTVGYMISCADGPGIANDTGFLASLASRVELADQP